MHILPFLILAALLYFFFSDQETPVQPVEYTRSESLWELLDYFFALHYTAQEEVLGRLNTYQRNAFADLAEKYHQQGDIPKDMLSPQLLEAIDIIHWELMARSMKAHLVLFNALNADAQDICLGEMGEEAGNFCSLNNLWLDTGELPLEQPKLWAARKLRAAVDEAMAQFYLELESELTLHIDRGQISRASKEGLIFRSGGYLADNPAKTLANLDQPESPPPSWE